mmetsp:Transcript_3237/g.8020  ORF Transcript_3237/g.8020 Transcript_3237/m.8020 type:complete len:328 (+) Transcript_3237:1340-2323(+)
MRLDEQRHALSGEVSEVEVGGEVGARVCVRVIPLVGEDAQPLLTEGFDRSQRRGRPRGTPVHLGDGLVDRQARANLLPVDGRARGLLDRGCHADARVPLERGDLLEVEREERGDLRAEGARAHLLLRRGGPHGHDVVRVHLVHRQLRQRGNHLLLPRDRHAERAEVRHHRADLVVSCELRQRLRRPAAQQCERKGELRELRLHLLEAAEHEAVLPDRRLQEVRDEAEDDGEGHVVLQREVARVEQCPVVLHALVAGHPVDDAARRGRERLDRREQPDAVRADAGRVRRLCTHLHGKGARTEALQQRRRGGGTGEGEREEGGKGCSRA